MRCSCNSAVCYVFVSVSASCKDIGESCNAISFLLMIVVFLSLSLGRNFDA